MLTTMSNNNNENDKDGNVHDPRRCTNCGVAEKDTALFELRIPEITGVKDYEPYCRSCSDFLGRSCKVREVTKGWRKER